MQCILRRMNTSHITNGQWGTPTSTETNPVLHCHCHDTNRGIPKFADTSNICSIPMIPDIGLVNHAEYPTFFIASPIVATQKRIK